MGTAKSLNGVWLLPASSYAQIWKGPKNQAGRGALVSFVLGKQEWLNHYEATCWLWLSKLGLQNGWPWQKAGPNSCGPSPGAAHFERTHLGESPILRHSGVHAATTVLGESAVAFPKTKRPKRSDLVTGVENTKRPQIHRRGSCRTQKDILLRAKMCGGPGQTPATSLNIPFFQQPPFAHGNPKNCPLAWGPPPDSLL